MYTIIRNKKSDALTLHSSTCPVAIKHYGKTIEIASFPTRFEAIESVQFHGGKVKTCKCALVKGEKTRQKNPAINGNHRDVKKALKLYKEFREATPKRGRQIEFEMPKVLMILGNVRFIGYDTTRRGKTELYKHDFAAGSRPLLCADGNTGQLFIVEGRYHVTPRGIVDIDSRGKEIDD